MVGVCLLLPRSASVRFEVMVQKQSSFVFMEIGPMTIPYLSFRIVCGKSDFLLLQLLRPLQNIQ